MAEPEVSLVAVAYGRRPLLARLLESVDRHTPEPHEVVVVDNRSPDDTAAWLEANRPDVRLVRAGSNLGYGRGANLGVRHAVAPTVVLLNTDVEVTAGWLGPLLETLQRSGVAIVAPASVDGDGEIVELGASVTVDGHVHVRTVLPPGSPEGRPVVVAHASASCWVFRAAWFERVGGFDPAYGLGYYEDLDLTAVAEARGETVVVDPRSRVRHDVGGSFPSELTRRLSHRNHLRSRLRWEWARRELPTAAEVHLRHRCHGRVLLLGCATDEAATITERLDRLHIGVEAVGDPGRPWTPAQLAEFLRGRGRVDDVLVLGEQWARGPDLARVIDDDAPWAVGCGSGDLDSALTRAGVAGSRVPRRVGHEVLTAVRGGRW